MSGKIKVRICLGTSCCFSGGEAIMEMLENDEELSAFTELDACHCMNKACDSGRRAPVVEVDELQILHATPEVVMEEIERRVTARIAGLPVESSGEDRDA